MALSVQTYVRRPAQPVRFPPLTWIVLTVLLVGPVVGPVFTAIGWPLLGLINWPLYLMGENVCPQPALRLDLFGAPMLICSRCWGGVFGLWIVLLSYRWWSGSAFWRSWRRMPDLAQIAIALLAFGPWVVDIVAYDHNLWNTPAMFLILSGVLGGLGAGALLLPLTARARRA
jgi:hypothetical protein